MYRIMSQIDLVLSWHDTSLVLVGKRFRMQAMQNFGLMFNAGLLSQAGGDRMPGWEAR